MFGTFVARDWESSIYRYLGSSIYRYVLDLSLEARPIGREFARLTLITHLIFLLLLFFLFLLIFHHEGYVAYLGFMRACVCVRVSRPG